MASSRWKRFAFFDRHTLALPNEVVEDVVAGGNRASGNSNNNNSNNSKQQSSNDGSNNQNVSLVVTSAGLPLTTRPSEIPKIPSLAERERSKKDGGNSAGNNTTANNNPTYPGGPAVMDDPLAVDAMWTSLAACSTPHFENAVVGDEILASAQFPNKQQQREMLSTHPRQAQQAVGSKKNAAAAASSTSMDGLVLSFLSSPETNFVHCVDVTVRCNPPLTHHGNNNNDNNNADLEDFDGWRGYFCPFVLGHGNNINSPSQQSSDATGGNNDYDTISDLAVCRLPPTTSGDHQPVHLVCLSKTRVVVWEDPHLHLSCSRPFMAPSSSGTNSGNGLVPADAKLWQTSIHGGSGSNTNSTTGSSAGAASATAQAASSSVDGEYTVVGMCPGVIAVGTTTGAVIVYAYNPRNNNGSAATLRRYLRIPPPLSGGANGDPVEVVSVQVFQQQGSDNNSNKISVFVCYNHANNSNNNITNTNTSGGGASGLCCYDMPVPTLSSTISAPSARHDLDGRHISTGRLVDAHHAGTGSGEATTTTGARLTIARADGLYTYSTTERVSVSPIDGNKLTVAMIPPAMRTGGNASSSNTRSLESLEESTGTVPSGYALLASTDEKSGRDAVDVYDSTNKLVAFHLLLSPGHCALRAAGVTTAPTTCADGSIKGGRASALVFTSGGSLVTLTEKLTVEKVDLLVKKNLYSAAVVVAYADPTYPAADITDLYRRYAEHLYRKGDLTGAVDQYIHTIGSLESSHVIFRFLDAPKIPLLVKYLNELRSRGRATPVHDELLKTCYLKLNDMEAAEAITSSASTVNRASLASVLSNLSANPKEALSTICALEAPEAVEILVIHGASLARVMPQETAGVVIALCVGTFSPRSLAQKGGSSTDVTDLKKMVEYASSEQEKLHEPYPVELFASSFIEQPKMLRLILAHCNRNKCPLTPALRRTLLELTLEEWNQAKRTGDTEAQKLRHKEAIAALTDAHCRDIGDYDALVIVQLAGFEEGELLLYERLQMTPMLLERYAMDGGENARRKMLALCQTDPEILPEVLGFFVALASERLQQQKDSNMNDDASFAEETEDVLDDIHATLALARRQAVAPPVRVARILAGEGTGQFSPMFPETMSTKNSASASQSTASTVPLSVALDYVGNILEESRQEGARLKAEVEEYNELCNSMEQEIESLLRTSRGLPPLPEGESINDGGSASKGQPQQSQLQRQVSIDELYAKIRYDDSASKKSVSGVAPTDQPLEAFWREMNQSEDSLETIARFFAKGVIR